MRRNDDVELFSMSFLDLISCAMAGILVLYTVADRSNEAAPPRKNVPGHISISFQDQKVGRLGFCVRLVNGSKTYESSSVRRTGLWVIKDNPLTALLQLNEPLAAGATLVVYVEDFDPALDRPPDGDAVKVSVVVYSPKSSNAARVITMVLNGKDGFYAEQKL
jgi:hypothetical protein